MRFRLVRIDSLSDLLPVGETGGEEVESGIVIYLFTADVNGSAVAVYYNVLDIFC